MKLFGPKMAEKWFLFSVTLFYAFKYDFLFFTIFAAGLVVNGRSWCKKGGTLLKLCNNWSEVRTGGPRTELLLLSRFEGGGVPSARVGEVAL